VESDGWMSQTTRLNTVPVTYQKISIRSHISNHHHVVLFKQTSSTLLESCIVVVISKKVCDGRAPQVSICLVEQSAHCGPRVYCETDRLPGLLGLTLG